MGNVLQTQHDDQLEEAVACYERALAIKPNYAEAHYNLGCALRALGRTDEALAHYRMALAFKPDYIAAGLRESLTQLLKGDFRAGWRNYERRWRSKDHGTPMRSYPQALWTGEKLASGRLLIWREQGIGDEIMFAGLVPDVLRTGNRCILECDARLRPLFVRSFPSVEVVSSDDARENDAQENNDPQTGMAAHLPSGSLPRLFRRTAASFAATTSPYLKPARSAVDRFRARYATVESQRLVGLAWYTSNHKTGRHRSIDLSSFAPLFARAGIRWISLQYGSHDALHRQAVAAGAPLLIDRSVDQLANIDLFAAQLTAMDLVITIDNSTAHLAGALGIPAWVLLPFASDWRWLEAREDCPWYPTLRLFRQTRRGEWRSVVERVASTL